MGEPAARSVIQEWLDRLFGALTPKSASDESKMLTNGVKR